MTFAVPPTIVVETPWSSPPSIDRAQRYQAQADAAGRAIVQDMSRRLEEFALELDRLANLPMIHTGIAQAYGRLGNKIRSELLTIASIEGRRQ